MPSEFISEKQRRLFDEIAKEGELILACGPKDISANIVGNFYVVHYPNAKEHRLEMGDGAQHVHIDWRRVKTVEHTIFKNEGLLIFRDGADTVFRLYRPDGEFSAETKALTGSLIDTTALWSPPTLKTQRLLLRPLTKEDAPSIFTYAKNPKVSQWTLWEEHKTIKDTLTFIEHYAFEYYRRECPEPLAITFTDAPDIVLGTVGCFWADKTAQSMELAYAIAEEHWGKGITVEAAQALIQHCFSNYKVKRIQARCKSQNVASQRVMQKLGMQFEGTLRSFVFHREQYWDVHFYALLKP